MSVEQMQDGSVLDYMSREHDKTAKAFPKLAEANRQNLGESMCVPVRSRPGSCENDCFLSKVRSGVNPTNCFVSDGLWLGATLLSTLSTRSGVSPANVAVDHDQQADANVEGDEADPDAYYEEADEEVLYGAPPGNLR